jgi:hypothetical protein
MAQKVAVATRAITHGIPTPNIAEPNIAENSDNVHGSQAARFALLFLIKILNKSR